MNKKSKTLEKKSDTFTDINTRNACRWQSPSNIALVKYWGKTHEQIPCNPSISFTLRNAHTITQLQWELLDKATENGVDFNFYFHGKQNEHFSKRIGQYLNRLVAEMPFLKNYRLIISSENTFPHSSGIASSASAMSALAAALVDMEYQINGHTNSDAYDHGQTNQRISHLSRLGSGSACRSIYPNAALWGHSPDPNSHDEYAVGLEDILHPAFHGYGDAILLVDQGEKKVSSSAGHRLMDHNPYAEVRYDVARKNTQKLLSILQSGDLDEFTSLVEEEAMTLHALMMASSPGYILMHPNTIHLIHQIRDFRETAGIPICFTLDAGPNIHLLYPAPYREKVMDLIQLQLLPFCKDHQWIDDHMGSGIQKLPL